MRTILTFESLISFLISIKVLKKTTNDTVTMVTETTYSDLFFKKRKKKRKNHFAE